jgi:hypothetical protein
MRVPIRALSASAACRYCAAVTGPVCGQDRHVIHFQYPRAFRRPTAVRLNRELEPGGCGETGPSPAPGEIDEAGTAYVGHLERFAALVAADGGGEWQQMAGWLPGGGRIGLRPRDLAALGVLRRVVH